MEIIALIGFVLLLIIVYILMYNNLIRVRNNVENAFGSLDAQLKKRYDLIPNLVAAVKQYAGYEKDVLTQVTELRTKAIASSSLSSDEKVALNNELTSGINKLLVSVENYPELQANENFMNLQRSLNEVEAQIAAARRSYNASVTQYNNAIQTFPGSIIANQMNMQPKQVLVFSEKERENVNVSDLFSK